MDDPIRRMILRIQNLIENREQEISSLIKTHQKMVCLYRDLLDDDHEAAAKKKISLLRIINSLEGEINHLYRINERYKERLNIKSLCSLSEKLREGKEKKEKEIKQREKDKDNV